MLPGRLRRLTRSSAVLTEIKRQDDSEKIDGKMEVQWKIRDTKIHRDATMSQRIGLGESARCSLHRARTGNSHMSFVTFQPKKKRKRKGSLRYQPGIKSQLRGKLLNYFPPQNCDWINLQIKQNRNTDLDFCQISKTEECTISFTCTNNTAPKGLLLCTQLLILYLRPQIDFLKTSTLKMS